MNKSIKLLDCSDEFDLDRIYTKLTASCTTYNVPANMFFVQPSGIYAEMQARWAGEYKQQEVQPKKELR